MLQCKTYKGTSTIILNHIPIYTVVFILSFILVKERKKVKNQHIVHLHGPTSNMTLLNLRNCISILSLLPLTVAFSATPQKKSSLPQHISAPTTGTNVEKDSFIANDFEKQSDDDFSLLDHRRVVGPTQVLIYDTSLRGKTGFLEEKK